MGCQNQRAADSRERLGAGNLPKAIEAATDHKPPLDHFILQIGSCQLQLILTVALGPHRTNVEQVKNLTPFE
jgi:hypothetical protein